tara:strand:+ start:1940 stop:2623 length:684 start_codon:yes stop_codon:yes gene_type:complete
MSDGVFRRISIRNGQFRAVTGGQETLIDSEMLDVTIVDAAKRSRTFYGNAYDAQNTSAPVCWSSDTERPDPEVPADTKQATRCMDCKQNIKGSGNGSSRACKYSQRMAVVLEDNPQEVYQLQLPANALFGSAQRGWMSMQDYAKHLHKHDTSVITVVTRICFEDDGYIPKLRFRPLRVLRPEELETAVEMAQHPDTARALAMYKPAEESTSPFEEVEGFVFDVVQSN